MGIQANLNKDNHYSIMKKHIKDVTKISYRQDAGHLSLINQFTANNQKKFKQFQLFKKNCHLKINSDGNFK